jgi:hypothetical protein
MIDKRRNTLRVVVLALSIAPGWPGHPFNGGNPQASSATPAGRSAVGPRPTLRYLDSSGHRRSASLAATNCSRCDWQGIQSGIDPEWQVWDEKLGGLSEHTHWLEHATPTGSYVAYVHCSYSRGSSVCWFEQSRPDGSEDRCRHLGRGCELMEIKDWDGVWWRVRLTPIAQFPGAPGFDLVRAGP